MQSELIRKHPIYYLRHLFMRVDSNWQDNNCIFTALRQYCLAEFGILLPKDTFFKVYNETGKGILPGQILQVISAVIEPFGLEIDQVFTNDPDLSRAVGSGQRSVRIEDSSFVNGKAGLCMINIRAGYSHAFFWQSMQVKKFTDPNFRLAIRLRCRTAAVQAAYSPLNSLHSYRQMLLDYLEVTALTWKATAGSLALMEKHIDDLSEFANNPDNRCQSDFRDQFNYKLDKILLDFSNLPKKIKKDESYGLLQDAGQGLRRIFDESSTIC